MTKLLPLLEIVQFFIMEIVTSRPSAIVMLRVRRCKCQGITGVPEGITIT